MKPFLPFLLAAGALLCPNLLCAANPELQRNLSLLQQQHEKALAAAAEPINRQYQSSLEQLLKKATDAKDFETATAIQKELAVFQVKSPASGPDLHAILGDTDWSWERGNATPNLHFAKDGTFHHDAFNGTWKVTSLHTARLKAAFGEFTLTFNGDFTAYEATSGDPQKQGVKGKRK